ncbi:ChbG/HpnK family deacetylase [Chloracidobacterium sp. MS 40/45]|uniref:ChbG/HpnK family deacetylase n=1 Tax=Chloracidobacterium aggregatum TaxID=2851959 RepID=UPI001B8B67DE|nr:ChbG/HpnK family deacetylase [Chloracidobacterium aggregatum]QUV99881.1 ChbG/HpnK family deacetylase [Chloracidobacterium sp. MS 40/45]
MRRKLIVNADDFGMCVGVNTGILRAHQTGIVTSTTLMANGLAFDDAVARLRDAPRLGVGIHLVLLGGKPVAPPSDVRSLLGPDGTLPNDFGLFLRRLLRRELRPAEIEIEFRAQVDKVLAAGLQPTHLDSHKHTHAHPQVLEVLLRVAESYGIRSVRRPHERLTFAPLAGLRPGETMTFIKQKASTLALTRYAADFRARLRTASVRTPDAFFGFAHTGLLNPALICYILRLLPVGTSELMCHPSEMDDTLRHYPTRLKASRVRELAALTDARVRAEITRQNIQLVSFAHLDHCDEPRTTDHAR